MKIAMYSKLFFIILLNSSGVSFASNDELQKESEDGRSRFKNAMKQLLFKGSAESKRDIKNATLELATVLPSLEDKLIEENLTVTPKESTKTSMPKKEKLMQSIFESRSMLSEIEEERVPFETISASHWQLIRGVGFKANDTACDLSLKYFKLGLSLYQAPIFPSKNVLRNHAIEYATQFLSRTNLMSDSPIISLELSQRQI